MSGDGRLARLWALLDPAPGGVVSLHDSKWMLSEAPARSVDIDRGNASGAMGALAADPVSQRVSEHGPGR